MCLTRNKKIFFDCDIKDNFSSRLILFLLHFAFFLTSYKDANDKKLLQNIYDFIFKQIDASLRESGDGDVSVNKKMKTYINVFHSIIPQIEKWNDKNIDYREIFSNEGSILSKIVYLMYYVDYVSIYRAVLSGIDPSPVNSIDFVKNKL